MSCPKCGYAANEEKAEVRRDLHDTAFTVSAATPAREEVFTGNAHSIDEVAAFLKISPENSIKTLVYLADGEPVVILMRGNDNLNEIKLAHVLGCTQLVMASDSAIEEIMGAKPGALGPIGIKVPVYADLAVDEFADSSDQGDFTLKVRPYFDYGALKCDTDETVYIYDPAKDKGIDTWAIPACRSI